MNLSDCKEIGDRLSGYMDDELTQADYRRVDVHMRSCPSCRTAQDDMVNLREAVAQSQPHVSLDDEHWERIMNDASAKTSRGLGWVMLIAGVATLVCLAVWEFVLDDSTRPIIKGAVALVWFGILFLFVSVVRQRMIAYKTDKYKDVRI